MPHESFIFRVFSCVSVAIVALLLWPSLSHAEVYRCVDAEKRVVYSGQPCHAGQRAHESAPLSVVEQDEAAREAVRQYRRDLKDWSRDQARARGAREKQELRAREARERERQRQLERCARLRGKREDLAAQAAGGLSATAWEKHRARLARVDDQLHDSGCHNRN